VAAFVTAGALLLAGGIPLIIWMQRKRKAATR